MIDDAKGWLARPFTSPLPIWAILALVGVFALLLWIVIDRQDVIRQAQELVETVAA